MVRILSEHYCGGEPLSTEQTTFKRLSQHEADLVALKHELLYKGQANGVRADFSFCDLTGLNLCGRFLADALFTGARLCHVDLSGANLDRANMFAADMRLANLERASMRRVDLRGVILRGANLDGADLFEADMREGRIAERSQQGELSFFNKLDPGPSEIVAALLSNTNLEQARMSGVIATQADFTDANMRGCKLVRAKLRDTKMVGAILEGADLTGADLSGANLENAVLVRSVTSDALYNRQQLAKTLTDDLRGRPTSDLPRPFDDLVATHWRWIESDGHEGGQLDLSGFDMRGMGSLAHIDLPGLRGENTVFYGLNMVGAKLQGAQLRGADLRTAVLHKADLRGASLREATLDQADLRDSNLSPLIGSMNQLIPTQLGGARMHYADLRGADLRHAVLIQADLAHANLIGADLIGADLTGANLRGTRHVHGAFDDSLVEDIQGIALVPRVLTAGEQ